MNKYEQLIEHIINDETDKARELFHSIVVEKSRDIYESLIDEQDLEEVGGNQVDSLVDEITADETGGVVEGDEEFGGEEETEEGYGEEEGSDNVVHHVHHGVFEAATLDKVPAPKHGDNGTNTKSTIDNMKNDMGGTAKNIAQSFSTEKGGTQGGLAKTSTTLQDAGNVNKPGANAGKTAFKKKEPGHGAEKKGAGESAGAGRFDVLDERL